jgi:hypothetical protein
MPNPLPRSLAFAALLCSRLLAAPEEPVDQVGKLAAEWIRIRGETVRIESEWAGQRDLLASIAGAVEQRAKLAEDEVALLKANTAQARGEVDRLAQKNQAVEKSLAGADERLRGLVVTLAALRPQLPPRLQSALELPYRSLENPALPAGDRMQHAMTILNRCVQFNRVITAGEETIATEGGSPSRLLEVIYWGLSHGYALDRAAGKAWLGTGSGQAPWTWEPLPDGVPQVTALLAMARDQADPEFVIAPARPDEPAR